MKALRLALVLTGALFVAEVLGGIASNSLALLLAISALILWEAVGRLRAPEPVASGTMLGVAVAGLLVNVACARILHSHGGAGEGGSLDVRGAYLHVLGDLLGSVCTVAAALVVRATGWLAADPVASIVTTLLIVGSSWKLVHASVDVLLESVPPHISLDAVRARLTAIDGVADVHDLHVWSVTSGLVAMSAHAVVPDIRVQQPALEAMNRTMREVGIAHVTVQLEQTTISHCEGRSSTPDPFVTPAQAGVQARVWIPASAGTTCGASVCLLARRDG